MRVLLATMLLSLLFSPTTVYAQGPTPTPTPPVERMYSRDELLEGIAAKPFTPLPLPDGLDTSQKVVGMVNEGGSWFLTVLQIWGYGPLQVVFLFFSIALAAALILGIIHKLQGKDTSVVQELRDIRRRR